MEVYRRVEPAGMAGVDVRSSVGCTAKLRWRGVVRDGAEEVECVHPARLVAVPPPVLPGAGRSVIPTARVRGGVDTRSRGAYGECEGLGVSHGLGRRARSSPGIMARW